VSADADRIGREAINLGAERFFDKGNWDELIEAIKQRLL
jgi:hypothetical protein